MRGYLARNRQHWFANIWPATAEFAKSLPADDIVSNPAVVLERAMTLNGPPQEVFAWMRQIGKRSDKRAGFYLSRFAELFLPRKGRALRRIDPSITLEVGDVIKDWGDPGKMTRRPKQLLRKLGFSVRITPEPTAQALVVDTDKIIVLTGKRGESGEYGWTWALNLTPVGDKQTRLHMRLRISKLPSWLPLLLSDLLDLLMTESFRKGMEERLALR